MITASWAMGAVALACFTCSVQIGHVRAGRRVPAGCERRAVRCGLLLGCLVCVQVAEEVLVREPLGIEVLDLEVGWLRAQSVPQIVHGALSDLAQVAKGAAGL